MAETLSNPFGQVPLGQGGTGKAVILDSYDAAKFDQAIIAAKQKKEEEDKAALKDARKAFELEDWTPTVDPWSKDIQVYSNELNDLAQRQTDITMEYFDLQNNSTISPEEFDKKSSEVMLKQRKWQQDKVKLNQNLYMSKAHEDISLKTGDEITKDNGNKYMKDASTYNKAIFDTPPEWLLEKTKSEAYPKGNQEQARNMWLYDYNGGSLIDTRFIHEDFATKMKDLIAKSPIINEYGSTYVKDGTTRINYKTKDKKFNEDVMRRTIVTNIQNDPEALKFYRDDLELAPEIMKFAGVDSVEKVPLTGKGSVLEFMATQDKALDFMKKNYFLFDETSYTKTGKDLKAGGYGMSVIPPTELKRGREGADVTGAVSVITKKYPSTAKWYGGKKGELLYGANTMDAPDFISSDAAIPQGEFTIFRESGTGEVIKLAGDFITTDNGTMNYQARLTKDIKVGNVVAYKKGTYVSEDIIDKFNLVAGEFQPVAVNLVSGSIRTTDGNVKKDLLAQYDAVEYPNNTPATNDIARQNERGVWESELSGKTIIDPSGNEVDAFEYLNNAYAKYSDGSYKGDRKVADSFCNQINSGTIKYKQ